MLEDGLCGLNGPRQNREDILEGEDISLYGIDWEGIEDEVLMTHHQQHNAIPFNNPFNTAPSTLSEVECTPPDCPLPAEGTLQLNHYLSQVADVNSRSMLARRAIWVGALHVCNQIS